MWVALAMSSTVTASKPRLAKRRIAARRTSSRARDPRRASEFMTRAAITLSHR